VLQPCLARGLTGAAARGATPTHARVFDVHGGATLVTVRTAEPSTRHA
jgi:hypothetical protein